MFRYESVASEGAAHVQLNHFPESKKLHICICTCLNFLCIFCVFLHERRQHIIVGLPMFSDEVNFDGSVLLDV